MSVALIQWLVVLRGEAFGWGATTILFVEGDNIRRVETFGTHQFILTEAYKDLQSDPAFVKGTFLPLESILLYEGNRMITGGSGPGPDADGQSPWSWHYYNPRLPGANKGQGPAMVKELAAAWRNHYLSNYKAACWSSHFLADMYCPTHMNIMPAEDIIKIYQEKLLADNKAITLGPEVTGPEGVANKDWRREVKRFLEAKKAAEADGNHDLDIFEVWYWDYPDRIPVPIVNWISQSTLHASHARWEELNPKHKRISNARTYDPNWKNGVTSFDNAGEVFAQQAEKCAIRAAQETVANYQERKVTNPRLGLQRAIQADYTLWRASFSALKPVVKVAAVKTEGNKRTYEISGVVNNFADETAKEVTARLIVYKLLDNTSQQIFEGKQKIGEIAGNRAHQATPQPWKVTVDAPGPNEKAYQLQLSIDVIGCFQKTPDLQYAEYEEELKVEATAANPTESVVVTFEWDKLKSESGGDMQLKDLMHLPNQDGLRLEEGMPLLADGSFKGEMSVNTNAGKDSFQLHSTLNGRIDKSNSNVSFKGECISQHTTTVNPANKTVTTTHFIYEGLGTFSNASSPEIRNNPPGYPAGGGEAKLTQRHTIQENGKNTSATNSAGRLPFKLTCFCADSAPPAPPPSNQPPPQIRPPATATPTQPPGRPGKPAGNVSTVTAVFGDVKVSSDAGDPIDVKKGVTLPAGQAVEIRTGADGGLTVRLPAGGTLIIPCSTVVRIETNANVILKQGAVDGDITEAAGNQRITVISPVAQITDDGTKFHIAHNPKSGITMVCVTEGALRIQPTKPGSAPFRVVAGQQIEVPEPDTSTPVNVTSEPPPDPPPDQKDPAVTVPPAAGPSLTLKTPSAKRGETIAVVVHSKVAASRNAWIALYKKGASSKDYICYTFLANLTDRLYDVDAPDEAGIYEFRLFLDEGYAPAAVSAPLEVK